MMTLRSRITQLFPSMNISRRICTIKCKLIVVIALNVILFLVILLYCLPSNYYLKVPFCLRKLAFWFNKIQYLDMKDMEIPGIIGSTGGGLGNQFFRFACAYALSKKLGVPLYLNVNRHRNGRAFLLDKFSIPMKQVVNFQYSSKIVKEITDEDIIFNMITPEMISTKFIYYTDYCESERYFFQYRDELKKMFVPEVDPAENNPWVRQWFNIITNFNHTYFPIEYESVAVHIRRGDFAKTWITPMRFYRLAMSKMLKQLKKTRKLRKNGQPVKFFVFSDSIGLVKTSLFNSTASKNELGKSLNKKQQSQVDRELGDLLKELDLENVFYVSESKSPKGEKLSIVEEFYLMTKCKHMIISFSTFSWWAAYLMENENKTIIYPTTNRDFFKHYRNELKIMMKTVMVMKYWYPEKWIKIDPFFK